MFKVVVAGTRTFNDYALLKEKLDYYLRNKEGIIIISGGTKGADELGIRYALEHKCGIHQYDQEWNRYGKSAGRNGMSEWPRRLRPALSSGMARAAAR